MMPAKLKSLVRQIGYRYFPTLFKSLLRYRVLRKPLGPGYRFEPELKIVRQLVAPGKAFIDVGAHAGTYGFMVEDIVGAEALYLFEPLPILNALLRKGFRNAHVHNLALSDRSGKAVIRIPYIEGAQYYARSSLCDDYREIGQTGSDEIEVDTITLDEFVATNPVGMIGFIKIDVEGFELQVLHGARNIISTSHPVLQVEIEQRHHARPIGEIIREIESWGYNGYYIDRDKLTLQPVCSYDVEAMQNLALHSQGIFYPYINNFLFFPPDATSRLVDTADRVLTGERGR